MKGERALSIPLSQALPETLKSLKMRPLFVLREQVPPLMVVGQTPDAFRRIGVIQGGAFEGERLSGEVVSGNDWQAVRTDSCVKLDVRLVLRTTDGALIVMTYQCLRAGPPNIIEKLDRGETVDPESYYFRMNPCSRPVPQNMIGSTGWLQSVPVTEYPTVPFTTSLRSFELPAMLSSRAEEQYWP